MLLHSANIWKGGNWVKNISTLRYSEQIAMIVLMVVMRERFQGGRKGRSLPMLHVSTDEDDRRLLGSLRMKG